MKKLKRGLMFLSTIFIALVVMPKVALADENEKTVISEVNITGIDFTLKAGSIDGIFKGVVSGDYETNGTVYVEETISSQDESIISSINRTNKLIEEEGIELLKEIKAGEEYTYNVLIKIGETSQYTFSSDLKVIIDGKEYEAQLFNADDGIYSASISKKITATGDSVSEETIPFLEGAKEEHDMNAGGTMTFRVDKDYSLFENGGNVYVDGILVDSSNYTSKSGSTIIEFAESFLETLKNGAHTLKVAFTDGTNAETTFAIKNNTKTLGAVTGANEEVDTTRPSSTSSSSNTTSNPSTNDPIGGYGITGLASMLGLIGTAILRRKVII